MNFRAQALVFLVVVVASVALSRLLAPGAGGNDESPAPTAAAVASPDAASKVAIGAEQPKTPKRRWDVLDPPVGAAAATVQLMNEPFSFLNYRTYEERPIASLTKLLTAAVVLENVGLDKKVPVSAAAIKTEGEAGGLSSGEVYTARDLLKIMLMTSSNDAAAALEEYVGGPEPFLALIKEKLAALGMRQTFVGDSTGLSDENRSTATDLVKLVAYIAKRHPDILSWSRLTSILVQPVNGATTRTITNINPLASSSAFLGGKTGTSPAALENLIAVMSHGTDRIVVVILGSRDRYEEVAGLLEWVDRAYEFNN